MFPGLSKVLCGLFIFKPNRPAPLGLLRGAGDTTRADINGDGILSAADLTALARMLEAQQGTQTADADENGAPVDTGAELNADAQDTVQTEDGGAPVEPAPAVDDVPETVEESVTGEVPQTEAGEQAA